jgi:tRNA(Ile)-lysidine synthase
VPAQLIAKKCALTLRNHRAGDPVRGGKKLKELLIDRKVPRGERRRLPLLARGAEVVWMHGIVGEKSGRQPIVSALTEGSGVQ